jgi:hypothetical protein
MVSSNIPGVNNKCKIQTWKRIPMKTRFYKAIKNNFDIDDYVDYLRNQSDNGDHIVDIKNENNQTLINVLIKGKNHINTPYYLCKVHEVN